MTSSIDSLARLIVGQLTADEIPDQAWPDLVCLALQQGLGPLLAWRLSEAGLSHWRNDRFPALAETMRQSAIAWLTMVTVRKTVEKALAKEQIPLLWLKGMALAYLVYPKPWLRPMGDVDGLVTPQHFRDARRLLEAATGQSVAMMAESGAMHAVIMLGPTKTVKLELHHSLLDAPISEFSADAQWFLERGYWADIADGRIFTLRPETHLIYLAAHTILQHGEGDFRLLRYLDLHQLITETPTLNWNEVVAQAVEMDWTYALARALTLTRSYFATPIPEEVLADLAARQMTSSRVAAAVKKQATGNRWQRTMWRFSTMGWRARLTVGLGLLFPAPEYMRWRYGIRHPWQLPFHYIYRWFDVAREAARSRRA